VLAGLVILLGTPALAPGQSLWRDGAPGGRLFDDPRARAVNDLLTILIVEQSASSRSANTSTSKGTTRTATVTKFPTFFDPVSRKAIKPLTQPLVGYKDPSTYLQDSLNLDLSGKASHDGKGSIDRTDKVTGRIAARVVKVLDNGNLMIEGRRSLVVNDETQVITISGIVRQQDITSANTVESNQIADAEVQMEGNGVLSEAQRPGILYRLLDWLGLF
jgi:flagellar L-ring protein precursor FlgH